MTWLLALGWPVALLIGWRWRVAYRQAWDAVEQTGTALGMVNFWRERAVQLEAELEESRTVARDWESAALVWQAVGLAPLRSDRLTGKVQ